MKYLRVAALAGVASALMSLVVNCQDHDVSQLTGAIQTPDELPTATTDRCVPGQTFQCMGGCGATLTGYQLCAADGRSYGPCMCPPLRLIAPLPSIPNRYDGEVRVLPNGPLVGGLPMSGGGGSSSSAGNGLVGAACRADRDCGGGLTCLTAEAQPFDLGGPAGGYCTTGCGSDAACQEIDRGSQCIGFAGQNICARSCASRASPPGVSKCLNRDDVMCVSVAARREEEPGTGPQAGLCLPACQSDAQCGPGLFCDLGIGLCSRTPPEGDPVGSTCDAAESCASGLCLTLNSGFESFCSGFCRFGGPGCGFDGNDLRPGAGCVIAQVPGEGEGDRGFCLELCETAADCREPGATCLPTAAGSLTRVCVVRTGTPPVTPDPDPGSEPRTGNPCTNATECGTGLVCLTSDSDPFGFGAGPPGGYCSATCSGGGCPEPGAVCVVTSQGAESGLCLRSCNPQTAGSCGSRAALVCNAFSNAPNATDGFCLPECFGDADCDPGTCDLTSGACVDDSGGEDPDPPGEPSISDECSEDSDCSTGNCLTSDSDALGLGGGFPGGYCSAECGAGRPCPEAGSVCVTVAPGSGVCLRSCEPQGAADCGDREALICVRSQDPARGFCVAVCETDAECDGRICSPELGLCVDPPTPECAQDEDCDQGDVCVTPPGVCSSESPECLDDSDCDEGECDTDTQTCVEPAARECEQDSDCTAGVCDTELGLCVAVPPGCTSDDDCGAQVCDTSQGVCVEAPSGCTSDDDCGAQVCDPTLQICVPPSPECTTDDDCATGVCDTARDVCVDAPVCTLDEDCADGVCDQGISVCIEAPEIPAGGACILDTDCVGELCASLDGATAFCTAFCLLGTPVGCEPYGSDAFCLLPIDPNDDQFGICIELCNTPADCAQPGYECLSLGGTLNGRTGGCLPPVP